SPSWLRLAVSLVLEFHPREWARAARTVAAMVIAPQPAWTPTGATTVPERGKSKVQRDQENWLCTPCRGFALAAVEFPHNLRPRSACRHTPLNRYLQALFL